MMKRRAPSARPTAWWMVAVLAVSAACAVLVVGCNRSASTSSGANADNPTNTIGAGSPAGPAKTQKGGSKTTQTTLPVGANATGGSGGSLGIERCTRLAQAGTDLAAATTAAAAQDAGNRLLQFDPPEPARQAIAALVAAPGVHDGNAETASAANAVRSWAMSVCG